MSPQPTSFTKPFLKQSAAALGLIFVAFSPRLLKGPSASLPHSTKQSNNLLNYLNLIIKFQ